MPALGGVQRQLRRSGRRSVLGFFELGDFAQQFAAMADNDAELFQVLIREIGQDAEVDAVVLEKSGVAAKTERGEPVTDLLHCSPTSSMG